jgi:hypothetical protein
MASHGGSIRTLTIPVSHVSANLWPMFVLFGILKLFLLLDRARRRLACMPSFSCSIVQPKIKACREEVYRLLEDGAERIGQGKITALSK